MDGHDRKEELVKMLDYAHYYQQVTEAKLSTAKLSEKMRHICNIETDVTNVFFIQLEICMPILVNIKEIKLQYFHLEWEFQVWEFMHMNYLSFTM